MIRLRLRRVAVNATALRASIGAVKNRTKKEVCMSQAVFWEQETLRKERIATVHRFSLRWSRSSRR